MWLCGGLGQSVVGRPTVSFQVVNRVVISCRYWTAMSRWRRGRKWGEIPLNADRNRWRHQVRQATSAVDLWVQAPAVDEIVVIREPLSGPQLQVGQRDLGGSSRKPGPPR